MSFLDKINRFASNPVNMNMKRSKFNLSHGCKTTFNSGELIPILVDEILPDDTVKLDVASVVRSITPAFPVMDNAYLDLFAFWVPARLCTVHDKDFQKIFGENTAGFWAPSSESTLVNTGNTWKWPNATAVSTYPVAAQSLANYMGFPIGFGNTSIELSRLPFNGYYEIWNEWFRDQNTQAPIDWKSWSNGQILMAVAQNTAQSYNDTVMHVNKFHDYFTSALPSPQKGNSVLLPLAGSAPVIPGATDHYSATSAGYRAMRITTTLNMSSNTAAPLTVYNDLNTASRMNTAGLGAASSSGSANTWAPSNLYADLTNASAASVNDLRQAFAIQKLLEKDARGGTRYREMLKAHFGVSIPDNTVQVPEYLGGKRIPLNMLQVLQTAEGAGTSPVGSTGAFSNTTDSSYLFTKSFAEFGYIYVLACVRPNQSYSQGINKMFFRNRRYDWYHPVFANLGEQAVLKAELYADSSSTIDPTVSGSIFGYQEAWAEYRFKPTKVTGYLGAGSSDTVAKKWTYSQEFSSAPTLNSYFLMQRSDQMSKSFVVTSASYQFIGDFFFNYTSWRAMPYFSIPGLIDHH